MNPACFDKWCSTVRMMCSPVPMVSVNRTCFSYPPPMIFVEASVLLIFIFLRGGDLVGEIVTVTDDGLGAAVAEDFLLAAGEAAVVLLFDLKLFWVIVQVLVGLLFLLSDLNL